jgi:hypothetical protein
MGFLGISIIATNAADSGKAPGLVPGPCARQSCGGGMRARRARAYNFSFFLIYLLSILCLF